MIKSGCLQSKARKLLLILLSMAIYFSMYSAQSVFAEGFNETLASAQKGDPQAQYNAGTMYCNGTGGTTQDYQEAVKWFNKAAEQGVTDAQAKLGAMYANGVGVVQDYNEAYKWSFIAAAQGNKNAIKYKEYLKEKLSSQSIVEIESAANELKAEIGTSTGGKASDGQIVPQDVTLRSSESKPPINEKVQQAKLDNVIADINKKWLKIKICMFEDQVRTILGDPLLIQKYAGGSIWYYQRLPKCREFELSQPHTPGIIIFSACRLEECLSEPIKARGAQMDRQLERIDVEGYDISVSHNLRVKYDKEMDVMNRKKDKLLENPDSSLVVNGIYPPDYNDQDSLLTKCKPLRVAGKLKWENPNKWRHFKIGMSERETEALLGKPDSITSEEVARAVYKVTYVGDGNYLPIQEGGYEKENGIVYHYGATPHDGTVGFLPQTDVGNVVVSWTEPFWPAVKENLQQGDANENQSIDDSNN